MDAYEQIQALMAKKYGKATTTRKATGDFMLSDNHAVNVKSNNVDKENYSPNMIPIKKMHEWVFEERKELSFLFVDYSESGGELKIGDDSRVESLCATRTNSEISRLQKAWQLDVSPWLLSCSALQMSSSSPLPD